MFGSLFANDSQTKEVINITQNSKVEIYSALFWKPCKEAKLLLQSRGIDFDTKMITFSRTKVEEMVKRTGGKTSVPQIFIDSVVCADIKPNTNINNTFFIITPYY